jgi:hypothetical protein
MTDELDDPENDERAYEQEVIVLQAANLLPPQYFTLEMVRAKHKRDFIDDRRRRRLRAAYLRERTREETTDALAAAAVHWQEHAAKAALESAAATREAAEAARHSAIHAADTARSTATAARWTVVAALAAALGAFGTCAAPWAGQWSIGPLPWRDATQDVLVPIAPDRPDGLPAVVDPVLVQPATPAAPAPTDSPQPGAAAAGDKAAAQ